MRTHKFRKYIEGLAAKQTMFDKVARHLLTQHARAVGAFGFCQYRTAAGLRCAIGVLIPDAVYSPLMENLPVERLVEKFPELKNEIPCTKLARSLQVLHDTRSPEVWPDLLRYIARAHDLCAAVVDELSLREKTSLVTIYADGKLMFDPAGATSITIPDTAEHIAQQAIRKAQQFAEEHA